MAAISHDEAARGLPVSFEASVTYYQRGNIDLFVQDGSVAIYVETARDLNLATGDRVLVEGTTHASFKTEIMARSITFLRHGLPPPPIRSRFGPLIRGNLDSRRVTVRAVVRAANVSTADMTKGVLLDLLMPGGTLQAQIADGSSSLDCSTLLDSTVEVTGAVSGKFDSKEQMTGIIIEVPSLSDLRVIHAPLVRPHQLPIRDFSQILQTTDNRDMTKRVRVEGTLTYFQPGAAAVLQSESHDALWADTGSEVNHELGEHVRVSGFPAVRNGSVVLVGAEILGLPTKSPVQVQQLNPAHLATGAHAFELVSVEGQLIMRVRENAQDQYIIATNGHVFSAIYRHPERGVNLPLSPFLDLPIGSRVRVTGICVLDRGDESRGPVAFHVLLRSSKDIAFLAGPSLISVQNLIIVLVSLLFVVFAAVGRAWLVERKMHRRHLAELSSIERWRARIIDGVNRAVPLAETMEQITEMLAFKLQVEYSWAEIEGVGRFGHFPPPDQSGLQMEQITIPAHTGEPVGKICMAFRSSGHLGRIRPDDFGNAARLASLAIETSEKYSALARSSEVDPLTKARNRFSFDSTLASAIENARNTGMQCGLIYIDLDKFKRVNDEFGHTTGDLYLQEIALRLTRQLRPWDTLARIGGDEFCVVIERVGSEVEVAEISSRLQSSFSKPFSLPNCTIKGSASFGYAVFPDHGENAVALLERADMEMYAAKRRTTAWKSFQTTI